jgi:hypothetical protein
VKKLIISITLSLMLVAVLAAPAIADDNDDAGVEASVTVNEVVSISLTDAGDSGIDFGSVDTATANISDIAQSDGVPAIQVVVEPETNVNVDIAVKGFIASGDLTLENWKYSLTYAGTKASLPAVWSTADYENVGDGSYDFYHWLDVPADTTAGLKECYVYYKAVVTGDSF